MRCIDCLHLCLKLLMLLLTFTNGSLFNFVNFVKVVNL